MAARKRNWIKGAIRHPGALRRSLKIKGSKPIPAKRLRSAAKRGGVTGRRARLALTLRRIGRGRRRRRR